MEHNMETTDSRASQTRRESLGTWLGVSQAQAQVQAPAPGGQQAGQQGAAQGTTQVAGGRWVWDDNERGIVLISQHTAPKESLGQKSRTAPARKAPGCLLTSLEITFQDTVDALDQMRFKRHIQRRVQPGEPDVVTLRDIKDVVLFQVQQELPEEFLKFFNTPTVNRFLRALILYCYCYIHTWDWLVFSDTVTGKRIRLPGLRSVHRTQQENLGIIRALLAREYLLLIAGVGDVAKYHHFSNGVKSWSQRDASLWEMLLRVSVRVTWVALQRRSLNTIEMEVGRLFRGVFNSAARRLQTAPTAQTNATEIPEVANTPGHSKRRTKEVMTEIRDEVLHSTPGSSPHKLFTRTPAALEILAREHSWTLLGLGVRSFPWCIRWVDTRLRMLESALTMPEEELHECGMLIGIMGMPRSHVDTMLNMRDKQRRQELLLSSGSGAVRTYDNLFVDNHKSMEPLGNTELFAFPQSKRGGKSPDQNECQEKVDESPLLLVKQRSGTQQVKRSESAMEAAMQELTELEEKEALQSQSFAGSVQRSYHRSNSRATAGWQAERRDSAGTRS